MNEEAKKIFDELRSKGRTFADIYDIATQVQAINSNERYMDFKKSLSKYIVEND